MIRPFRADLHVHTLLSPCAAVEMTPNNIIRHAALHGIDIVAITDHNASDNVLAAVRAAEGTGVTVLPGMEVETKEEIHLIVLFEKMRDLARWQDFIRPRLSGLENDERRFGAQFVVDEQDNLVSVKSELLLHPLSAGIEEVAAAAAAMGGLIIASHIDRPAYSIFSQLGFVPPGVPLDAVEVSRNTRPDEAAARFRLPPELPVIVSSDAHTIADFVSGPHTVFFIENPTLAEIRMALKRHDSREVILAQG